LHQLEFKAPVELVLIARASMVGQSYGQVEKVYLNLLRQAKLIN